MIEGANLSSGGDIAPKVQTAFGSWAVSQFAPNSITVVVPLQHPLGAAHIKVSNSIGSAMLKVQVQ